jgi:hypothetical protein
MSLTHAVIIRMKYLPGDPRWPWRFAFFRDEVLPRILAQTDQNFDLCIWCHPHHRRELSRLDPKVQAFTTKHPPKNYHIQTRTDTDDWLETEYIAKAREVIRAEAREQPLVVNFQPWKLDLRTGRVFQVRRRYGPQEPSMFLSLFQPDLGPAYRQVYCIRHNWMHRLFPRVITVPEGYCYLVIHDANGVSQIHRGDKEIET